MSPDDFFHTPVLFDEVMEGLSIRPWGVYVDGTVGGGGHALGVVQRLSKKGRFVGIDRDFEAVKKAREVLKDFADVATIVQGNYADTAEILDSLGIMGADGILLDLGVSSHQLDDGKRGFSYSKDAVLDMRMDQSQKFSAFDVINGYSEKKLYDLIRDYGEERFAKNIAKYICLARKEKPIETTLELVDIIKTAIPKRVREKRGHPAKKTFQAIRIEVNGELDILRNSIDSQMKILNDHGRLVVISFHSLEDRIIKNAFRSAEESLKASKDAHILDSKSDALKIRKDTSAFEIFKDTDSYAQSVFQDPLRSSVKGKVINRKVITASDEEINVNPRAKSAKLRIFERLE